MLAWWLLLAVDLWQVTARVPGSLGAGQVVWLAAFYAAAVAGATVVLRAARCRGETATVIVLAAGLALFATETVLRALGPDSPWRMVVLPLAVAASVPVGLACGAVAGRMAGRVRAAVATVLVLGGAAGATIGGGVGASTVAEPSGAAARANRPNVLLLVVDTLRADHLGCYGYQRPTSPVLDRLAADGVLFERAFAQSSWTKPSMASLLTSRLPSQHGALLEASVLPTAETTAAEIFGAAGYRTAVLSGNPWITPEYGFGQGVEHFLSVYDERFVRVTLFMTVLKRVSRVVDGKMRLYNRLKYRVLGELSTTARDVRLVDEALAWLATQGDRPFFLNVHLMSPHHPYDPPAPFDRFVPDPTHAPVKNYPKKSYDPFERGAPLPAADRADMVARYDGDVLHADAEIGRLLAGIERLGLASRTLVVVTADHGEEFFDHENWGHGQSVYDELVRVPLVMRWPGRVEAGRRHRLPVRHLDVLPSLLAAAALPPAARAIGRDLLGPPQGGAEVGIEAMSELVYRGATARMLVSPSGDRKLMELRRGAERRTLVFDLQEDPAERRPLAAEGDVERRLSTRLAEIVRDAEATRAIPATTGADPETAERLRALGYGE